MGDEKWRFDAVFDLEGFLRGRKSRAGSGQPLPVDWDRVDNEPFVVEKLAGLAEMVCREPKGNLKHPYLVPAGPYEELWDGDAFFCGLALFEEHMKHFQGSILNLLEHVTEEGQPPRLVTPDRENHQALALPLHAQWCAIVTRTEGDGEWVRPWWSTLRRVREWYERQCGGRHGLFRLKNCYGYPFDNDPVIYGRRSHTVAPVDVNCYHYREHQAMAMLAQCLGYDDESEQYRRKADTLRKAINRYMWDPVDGMYYHLDLSDFEDVKLQPITWEVPYKVRSATCLWPLWAGVATKKQADQVIGEHVLNPNEFLSDYGIRSLAKNERIYNNLPMGNPSNWQGPVWGLTTFVVAYGLARYGYQREALDVSARLVASFAADLRINGVLHEYYHADTGAPMMNPGFLCWNLLACRVLDDLRKHRDPAAIRDSDVFVDANPRGL